MINMHKCWICMDKGFLFYYQKFWNLNYEYVAHCTCEKGKDYAYDGRKPENKGGYFCPSVNQIFESSLLAEMAKNNKKNWIKNNSREVQEVQDYEQQKFYGRTFDELNNILNIRNIEKSEIQ